MKTYFMLMYSVYKWRSCCVVALLLTSDRTEYNFNIIHSKVLFDEREKGCRSSVGAFVLTFVFILTLKWQRLSRIYWKWHWVWFSSVSVMFSKASKANSIFIFWSSIIVPVTKQLICRWTRRKCCVVFSSSQFWGDVNRIYLSGRRRWVLTH